VGPREERHTGLAVMLHCRKHGDDVNVTPFD
jgi:hypothetical protein